jgi:hypothetical protein
MPTLEAEVPKEAAMDLPEPMGGWRELVYLAAESLANFEALRGWGQALPRAKPRA